MMGTHHFTVVCDGDCFRVYTSATQNVYGSRGFHFLEAIR